VQVRLEGGGALSLPLATQPSSTVSGLQLLMHPCRFAVTTPALWPPQKATAVPAVAADREALVGVLPVLVLEVNVSIRTNDLGGNLTI